MVFLHHTIQRRLDIVRQPIGQERQVHSILLVQTFYIMATTGLVLLVVPTPTTSGKSVSMVTSAPTPSATRTTVCAPAFQSRLRSPAKQ